MRQTFGFRTRPACLVLLCVAMWPLVPSALRADETITLFPNDGPPKGWQVTDWSDLAKPPPDGAQWLVRDKVLEGSNPRGTWLMSKAQFKDFVLDFEWKLPERGNSGVALRSPLQGDPAFDGLELQMVDPRYFPADLPEDQKPKSSEITGALYRAMRPMAYVYKPDEWNRYVITMKGPKVSIVLNDAVVQHLDLNEQTLIPKRHDGSDAPPLKDRPRSGHIGFQELSRGGGHVEIRNATIRIVK